MEQKDLFNAYVGQYIHGVGEPVVGTAAGATIANTIIVRGLRLLMK